MKKTISLPRLFIVFCLAFLLLLESLAINAYTAPSVASGVPYISNDEFLFVDTHTNKKGVGKVGGYMFIDFPTYLYSEENKALLSLIEIDGYTSQTNVIIGSGMSLTGTAGSGAATGLNAYTGFSSEGLFTVDADLTVHYFMNGDWRTVAVGETWEEVVEKKPDHGDGTLYITYTIKNNGILKRSNLTQPGTPTYTPIPSPTPTPTASNIKVTIIGYVRSRPGDYSDNYLKDFKVELSGAGASYSKVTDISGYYYFNIPVVPEKEYTLKVSKAGYLTRTVSNILTNKDIVIGTIDQPIIMFSGDINNDGAINMVDVVELAEAFNSTYNDKSFNENADLNYDHVINMLDIITLAANFNKTSFGYPTPTITELIFD